MRITRLKVGCRTYRVERWPEKEADDDGARGDCNYRKGRIRVADGYKPSAQAETIIHECLHAILKDAGMADHEEALVERLAPRLAAFMADNPDEVRELLRMLK
jgi:hypothetical protein